MSLDARVLLREADAHVKAGRIENAIALWLRVADFYEEQHFFLKAVALHRQVLQTSPRMASQLALIALYATLGLQEEARRAIEDALAQLPHTVVRESAYRQSAADRGDLLRFELESVRATMRAEDLRALRDRWR